MLAVDLLEHLRSLGLALTVESTDRLSVSTRALLTDEIREVVRANKIALLDLLAREREGDALLPDACHPLTPAEVVQVRGWTEAEIERAMGYMQLARRHGLPEAALDHVADRLTQRDQNGDDRVVCLECRHLDQEGRCAQDAAVPSVSKTGFRHCNRFRCAQGAMQ